MKTLFAVLAIVFACGSQSYFAQTKTLTCQQVQEKLGKNKMLQLYWTEKLGESILANGFLRPSKKDSAMVGKKMITASHYVFFKDSTTTMEFRILMYNGSYDLNFDDAASFTLHTRFLVYGPDMEEITTYLPVKKMYLKLTGKDDYEPSEQDMEELCKRLTY